MAKHKDNARERLMSCMMDIVRDEGAGALTYDNLVAKSGLTRGGILYHFPSKDSMLQGLVDDYIRQEVEKVEARWEKHGKTADGLLKAEIECALEADDKDQQINVSLLPVVIQNPAMMKEIQQIVEERYQNLDQTSIGFEKAALTLLVVDAFEMSKAFGFTLLSEKKRKQILKFLYALVEGKKTL
jgi:AcrR family transcriptional regulator